MDILDIYSAADASVYLSYDGVTICAKEKRYGLLEKIFLTAILACASTLLLVTLVIILLSFRTACISMEWLPAILGVFFAIAVLPGFGVCIWLHSLIFGFTARLVPCSGRYYLSSGIFKIGITLNPRNITIVIFSTYSHGDWGYSVKLLRSGRHYMFGLPLIASCIVGTGMKTQTEARRIIEWLEPKIAPFVLKIDLERN